LRSRHGDPESPLSDGMFMAHMAIGAIAEPTLKGGCPYQNRFSVQRGADPVIAIQSSLGENHLGSGSLRRAVLRAQVLLCYIVAMSAPCKYPPSRTIAVDVDGTLLVNGRLNARLIEFCRAQRARGFSIMLWSARGKAYAQAVAERFEIVDLFDDIVGKPGYIVDDLGWTWIKFTRVVRSFGEPVEGRDAG
jgi:hypothetical protein